MIDDQVISDQFRPTFHHVFLVPNSESDGSRRRDVKPLRLNRLVKFLREDPSKRKCCQKDCLRTFCQQPKVLPVIQDWRKRWNRLSRAEVRNAVLQHIRDSLQLKDGTCQMSWSFLGQPLCRAGFILATGVSASVLFAAMQQFRRGEVRYQHPGFERHSPVMEMMRGALWALIDHLQERLPLKDQSPGVINMPFHHKIYLFRLLQRWHQRRLATGEAALLKKKPNQKTFFKILREPEFRCVKFHRVVEMGRCPVCCVLQHLGVKSFVTAFCFFFRFGLQLAASTMPLLSQLKVHVHDGHRGHHISLAKSFCRASVPSTGAEARVCQ